MARKLRCPHCQAVLTIADHLAGKNARCTKCAKIFTIPGMPVPPPTPQVPPPSTAFTAPPSAALNNLPPLPEIPKPASPPPGNIPNVLPVAKKAPLPPAEVNKGVQEKPGTVPPPPPIVMADLVEDPILMNDLPAGKTDWVGQQKSKKLKKSGPAPAGSSFRLIAGICASGFFLLSGLIVGFWALIMVLTSGNNAPVNSPDPGKNQVVQANQPGNNPLQKNDPRRDKEPPPGKEQPPDKQPPSGKQPEFPQPPNGPTFPQPPFNPPVPQPPFEPPLKQPPVNQPPNPVKLPPAPEKQLPILPPKLEGEKISKQMPDSITDIAVGGGGRFILMHLSKLRKLALFDVNEAKVVHYFPLGEDEVAFAAGMEKLLIVYPGQKVIQRYDLLTHEREVTAPLDVPFTPKFAVMGSASAGPLLVAGQDYYASKVQFFDIKTLKTVDLGQTTFGGSQVRVSADGMVFTCWEPGLSPNGIRTYILNGDKLSFHSEHDTAGHLLPGADGKIIYTANGRYTNQVKKLGAPGGYCLPAVKGPYFFAVKLPDGFNNPQAKSASLTLYMEGNDRSLYTLNDVEIGSVAPWASHGRFGTDKRILFIPDAKVLVTFPVTNDRIVVQRFDIEEALEKSGIDYLLVTSQPPTMAQRGASYSYQMVVKSKKGGVKYKLDAGPDGMKMDNSGKLTWSVPQNPTENPASVILSVSDSTSQEVYQTYKLDVVDKLPEVVKVGGKDPVDPPAPEPKKPPEPKEKPPEPPVTVNPAPPAPQVGSIKPAPLKADKEERMLPSSVSDACIGGGGRFFILHLPKDRKLAVFDVNEAKVVKYLPASEDNVKFAAGMNKLFVVFPDKNIIQRFSLITFEKEVTVPLAIEGKVKAIATGSAASGPILVYYQKGFGPPVTFMDPVTLKELKIDGIQGHMSVEHFRASPDGTVFGAWPTSYSQSMTSIVLAGTSAKVFSGEMAGIVVPGSDNTLVAGGGLYTPECKSLGSDKLEPRYRFRVPSQTGRFYLTCPGGGGAQINTGVGDVGKPVQVHLFGDSRPIAKLDNVDLPVSNEAWTGSDFTQDKRVLFVPEGKLIAIIPKTNDRLVLHRFDVDVALEKAGVDYLFVISRPPSTAFKGTKFAYKLDVKSKQGGLKFKLEAGPTGMKVSETGELTWVVPQAPTENPTTVILSISDKSGQEVYQTFKLDITDPVPGQVNAGGKEPAPPEPKQKNDPPGKEPVVKDPPKTPEKGTSSAGLSIVPPKLDQDISTLKLPGTISKIVVGGGGRYLIFHVPGLRQIGIFDVNEAKVVKYLPAAEDTVCLAAGMNKLLVALPNANAIQRWDLETFQKEVTGPNHFGQRIAGLCMGSASQGPVMVILGSGEKHSGETAKFLDLKTLGPFEPTIVKGQLPGMASKFVRASADGTIFTTRNGVGGEGHSCTAMVLSGKNLTIHTADMSTSVLVPDFYGKLLYSGYAVYTPELKAIFPNPAPTSFAKPFVPAHHGPYFMRFDYKDWDKHGGAIAFFMKGDTRHFAQLENIESVTNEQISYGGLRDTLCHDERVHFIPRAKLLVTIPKTNDQLILRRFDPEAELEKSGIDYLFVQSEPETVAEKGKLYQYQVGVRSKKGGGTYQLNSGPPGMAISKTGLITWNVPAGISDTDTDVILTISDKTGQEIFHTFKISVKDRDR